MAVTRGTNVQVIGTLDDPESKNWVVAEGEDCERGQLMALRADGLAYLANAGVGPGQQMPAKGFASEAAVGGERVTLLRHTLMSGWAQDDPGRSLWVGTVDGECVDIAPDGAGDIQQCVGACAGWPDDNAASTEGYIIVNIDDDWESVVDGGYLGIS